MGREPVAIIELVKILVQSALLWVIGMGWWQIDNTQQMLTLAFFMALINLVGAFVQRAYVTPVMDPRAPDGRKLLPDSLGYRGLSER